MAAPVAAAEGGFAFLGVRGAAVGGGGRRVHAAGLEEVGVQSGDVTAAAVCALCGLQGADFAEVGALRSAGLFCRGLAGRFGLRGNSNTLAGVHDCLLTGCYAGWSRVMVCREAGWRQLRNGAHIRRRWLRVVNCSVARNASRRHRTAGRRRRIVHCNQRSVRRVFQVARLSFVPSFGAVWGVGAEFSRRELDLAPSAFAQDRRAAAGESLSLGGEGAGCVGSAFRCHAE